MPASALTLQPNTASLSLSDTGLRSGAENLAIDRALLATGKTTLRFYRSLPHASIGRHQAIDRELRTDYCEQHGIERLRRVTGGGALYVDENQLGFSLILGNAGAHDLPLAAWLEQGCEALARGLQEFGIDARHKFPNDLEIDGRKIASLFATNEDGTLLLHGNILFDADVKTMLEALRVPTEKLSPDGLAAARDRLATLAACCAPVPSVSEVRHAIAESLAAMFGLALRPAGGIAPLASPAALPAIDWRDGEKWLEALWKTPGGVLRARARFDDGQNRLARIEFAADCQLSPPDTLTRLQETLAGLPLARLADETQQFFQDHPADMPGVSPLDFRRLLCLLLDKHAARHGMRLDAAQANALMAHNPAGQPLSEILERSTVMLVPYCAKPAWCKWRHQDGCTECGLCEVGEAYRLARERGMRVTTVTRYEHLLETLADMKADGVAAYVGMCCGNFFVKRHRAFQEAGMPAVLMDISGANCYELKQEDQAYAGTFQAEARLDAPLLRKMMKFVATHRHNTQEETP